MRKMIPVQIAGCIMPFDTWRGEIKVLDALMTIPGVVLFLTVQKYFLHGVLARVVKGRVTASSRGPQWGRIGMRQGVQVATSVP